MALPRKHRLGLSQQKASELRKTGKKIHTSFLTGFLSPGSQARFAVVVGLNISKKATVRNKVRRLLQQEIMASLSSTESVLGLPKDMKVDMMIYPKREIVVAEREKIVDEVQLLFRKVKENI